MSYLIESNSFVLLFQARAVLQSFQWSRHEKNSSKFQTRKNHLKIRGFLKFLALPEVVGNFYKNLDQYSQTSSGTHCDFFSFIYTPKTYSNFVRIYPSVKHMFCPLVFFKLCPFCKSNRIKIHSKWCHCKFHSSSSSIIQDHLLALHSNM